MTVCPALVPPWLRTTMAAREVSTSMILPLPSSPHCAPIRIVFAIFQCGKKISRRHWGRRSRDLPPNHRKSRQRCKRFQSRAGEKNVAPAEEPGLAFTYEHTPADHSGYPASRSVAHLAL